MSPLEQAAAKISTQFFRLSFLLLLFTRFLKSPLCVHSSGAIQGFNRFEGSVYSNFGLSSCISLLSGMKPVLKLFRIKTVPISRCVLGMGHFSILIFNIFIEV